MYVFPVEAFFTKRFMLGSKAQGPDHWTFLLARTASLQRLDALGTALAGVLLMCVCMCVCVCMRAHLCTRSLTGIYTRENLQARLGRCADNLGCENKRIRADSPELAPALGRLEAWLGAHSTEMGIGEKIEDATLDGAMIHMIVMLGLALDPLYAAVLRRGFGGRVKLVPHTCSLCKHAYVLCMRRRR